MSRSILTYRNRTAARPRQSQPRFPHSGIFGPPGIDTPEGDIASDVLVMHRITGLAHDGSGLWSLDQRSRRLSRLDPLSGAALDSAEVAVPDLVDLSSDGQAFWSISWFTGHLYQLSAQGEVVKAWPLPPGRTGGNPEAIACAGTDLWFARDDYGSGSLLYRLRVAP